MKIFLCADRLCYIPIENRFSIRENIVLPMRLDGKEIDIDFFNEIVEILGLKDKLERFPSTLSGGQQPAKQEFLLSVNQT